VENDSGYFPYGVAEHSIIVWSDYI
jgi:hypothetical protein